MRKCFIIQSDTFLFKKSKQSIILLITSVTFINNLTGLMSGAHFKRLKSKHFKK